MKSTKSASRYAKALLELCIEQNNVDQVAGDMKYLEEVHEDTKDFKILLNSPVINSDKKIAIFNEIFGQFETLTTSFINLITKNRREYMLPAIAYSFNAQLKAQRGIVPISIVSATALNKASRDLILAKVGAAVNGKLEVTESIDESLIGGFIVNIDDKQIDASIASQFNNLKQRLTS